MQNTIGYLASLGESTIKWVLSRNSVFLKIKLHLLFFQLAHSTFPSPNWPGWLWFYFWVPFWSCISCHSAGSCSSGAWWSSRGDCWDPIPYPTMSYWTFSPGCPITRKLWVFFIRFCKISNSTCLIEPISRAASFGAHRSDPQQSQKETERIIVYNRRGCGFLAAVQRHQWRRKRPTADPTLPGQYQPAEAQIWPGQEPQSEP